VLGDILYSSLSLNEGLSTRLGTRAFVGLAVLLTVTVNLVIFWRERKRVDYARPQFGRSAPMIIVMVGYFSLPVFAAIILARYFQGQLSRTESVSDSYEGHGYRHERKGEPEEIESSSLEEIFCIDAIAGHCMPFARVCLSMDSNTNLTARQLQQSMGQS